MLISSSFSSVATSSNNDEGNDMTKSSSLGWTTPKTPEESASMPASASRWVFWRYTGMIALALVAGSMDWKMQRQLQVMSENIQSALRVATLDLMEQLEGYELQKRVEAEEEEVQVLEQKAVVLDEEANAEEAFVNKSRMRGEYMLKMSDMEEHDAELLIKEARFSSELRQKVLANLTLEVAERQQTLEQIRSIREGMCNWSMVHVVCDTVGGITGLQQKADAEALLIQTEWRQADSLQKREHLQEMIAEILLGKAEQYNETAQYLKHVADLWDEHAQAEFEMAHFFNETAQALEVDVQGKEAMIDKEQVLEQAAETEIHNLLHLSQIYHVRAYWYAIVALMSGFSALVYFVGTSARRFLEWLGPTEVTSFSRAKQLADDVWQTTSYLFVHVLFFLTVLGMTGYYLCYISRYSVAQRAVIVIWFASLGALFQTFFLHAIPRFLVEVRAPTPDLTGFALHVALKGCVIFCIYSMEVLFVCVTIAPVLFAPAVVSVFNTLGFCLFSVGTAIVYAFYFDTGRVNRNENIAVWQCADDRLSLILSNAEKSPLSSVSEATPLRIDGEWSGGSTLEIPNFGVEEDQQTTPLRVLEGTGKLLKAEFSQLLLPFELLVIASLGAVLRNCLQTVWNSQATGLQCAVLACACVLLLMGAVLVKDLTCEECYELNQGRRKRSLKRLDAFELVAV